MTVLGANLSNDQSIASRPGVTLVRVSTTAELQDALLATRERADVLVFAAAVADYRFASPSVSKLKKSDVGQTLTLELVQNPDLLAETCAARRDGQIIVGFAAETASGNDLLELASQKLSRKGCDLIVANDVTAGAVFGSDSTRVLFVDAHGRVDEVSGSKSVAANALLDLVATRLRASLL